VTPPLPEGGGEIAANIVHFTRALRKAGVRTGTAQVETAIRAVQVAGFTRREDFYHILRATLITRPEHLAVFHQLFAMFWRDPEYLNRMIRMMLPLLRHDADPDTARKAAERRAAEALEAASELPDADAPEQRELVLDARASWSRAEVLRGMDFEQMSAAELAEAGRAIDRLQLPVDALRTRRFRRAAHGRKPDIRAMMRRANRRGGELDRMLFRAPVTRPPDLVAICDISGSMSVYARMMMRFLHALVWAPDAGWGRVSGFTFGTQLTNITRALHLKDADAALAAVGRDSPDWQGGTRIGGALHRFNRDWSRRVLGRGAVVLLITDGLERGDVTQLAREAERLSLSCRNLIWLNPLLRWQGFAPRAAGIRAILPHVTSFHACHSLDSLSDLTSALSGPGDKPRLMAAV